MKKVQLAVSIVFIMFFSEAVGQRRLLEKLASNEADTTKASSFLPIPALGYRQETGLEFGVAILYSFYSFKQDTITRNSSINGAATLTTKKQSNFIIKSDVWTKANTYHIINEIRFRNFPFNFYGVGNNTAQLNEDKIDLKLTRLMGEVEKAFSRKYYGGLNVNFESYTFSDKEAGGIYSSDVTLKGREGGKVMFLGASQIFDTRNTNTYTTKGWYFKLNYSYAPNIFGRENFTGNLLKLDGRRFFSLSPQTVLGLNIAFNTIQGDNTPFYLLQQLGNDQLMRGYYSGRYRDENLLAAQAEVRYRFMPRLGVAAFGGGGNVFKNHQFDFAKLKPSYGAGLRYFFDIEKGLSVRFDYGIGEKRAGEERQKGFYISFGEAF